MAAICEEFEDHQDRTGQPVILVGQSIVHGEIKAEVRAHYEEPRDAQIILQQYVQQVESLSPENRLSKFCKEAGFMRVVQVGQYFVTRDASEFQYTIACREYTLPRDDKASQPKGWIRGNTRIGPILEVTTSLTIERRNQWKRQDQTIHKIMVGLGLLKCGKVEMENTIDRGNLRKILGIHCKKLTLIVENIFSAGRRILPGTKRLFTIGRGDPLQRISKERQILKSSSWEVTQQNLPIKSGTKCEFGRKECQAMQRIVPNIR